MKVSVIWALALLSIAAITQAQSPLFSKDGLLSMKEKLEKLKDFVKSKTSMPLTLDAMSKDVTKRVMEGMPAMSSNPIKDKGALQGFVNHLISTHAEGVLMHHNKTAAKLVIDVQNYFKKYNVKIPATISWAKMTSSLRNFCIHQFFTYKVEFHGYLSKFKINLKAHTSHQALKYLLKSVIDGNDYKKIMTEILNKYSVAPVPSVTNEMMVAMKAMVQRVSNRSHTELDKILREHGLFMANDGLTEVVVKMVEYNLKAQMMKPTTVEEKLKDHFNQAMDLMHKAVGPVGSEKMHSMMESIRKMVPHMLNQHIRKMKHQLQQAGHHVSYEELLRKIGEKTRHLRTPISGHKEDKRRKHHGHHHHPHHHRHHERKKLYMAIFIPIGAILVIALISTLIYCIIKSKRGEKDSAEKFEKAPSKKVNPYQQFDDPRSVSKA